MIQELQTERLDINKKYEVFTTCKQGDNLKLKIIVYDKTLPADLSDYTCRLRAFKRDQIPLIQDTNITITDNTVYIECDEQLTTTAGIFKAELQFVHKTTLQKKSSFYIIFNVISSVFNVDGAISTPTCTLLKQLENDLDRVENIGDVLEEAKDTRDDLIVKTDAANTSNENLVNSTNAADNTKNELDILNTNAKVTKNDLDKANTAAVTNKNNLDAANVQAVKNYEALEQLGDATDLAKKVEQNSSQLNANVQDISNIKTDYAKKTDVNELADNKAEKTDLQATNLEVIKNTTDIATQTARIDNFTKLAQGSTTGDAELQDIRVGADAKTYESAGTAVREQFKNVKNNIYENTRKIARTILETREINCTVPIIAGQTIPSDGELSIKVDIKQGEKFQAILKNNSANFVAGSSYSFYVLYEGEDSRTNISGIGTFNQLNTLTASKNIIEISCRINGTQIISNGEVSLHLNLCENISNSINENSYEIRRNNQKIYGVKNTVSVVKGNSIDAVNSETVFSIISGEKFYIKVEQDGSSVVNTSGMAYVKYAGSEEFTAISGITINKEAEFIASEDIKSIGIYIKGEGIISSGNLIISVCTDDSILRITNSNSEDIERINNSINRSRLLPIPEDDLFSFVNGISFANELDNHLTDFKKVGDLMVHVSTFCIINDIVYVTYYANTRSAGERPSEQTARFAYCRLDDLENKTFIDLQDIGDVFNKKSVSEIYDTILLKKDNDTLYLMWTAKLDDEYYRLYRIFTISTNTLSEVYANKFKVNNTTYDFCSKGIKLAFDLEHISHKYFGNSNDIGIMQKLTTRVEDGITYYYTGAYINEFNCIIKSKDLITWEYVAQPTFENKSQWENSTYVIGDKCYYFMRQTADCNEGILTCYDLNSNQWDIPVFINDCQSRSDFFEYNGELYLIHAQKDRNHLSILNINKTALNRSVEVQTAKIEDYFYPFVQIYNDELYISFTQSRRHIWLSKFTINSISVDTIANKFRELFSI